MRGLFLLLILAGLGAAFGYPWYFYNMSGSEIGSYPVYRSPAGFQPVIVHLTPDQSPVRVFVDMIPMKGWYPDQARTALTLTAATNGKTVMATGLSFIASQSQLKNIQTADIVFRDGAGDLAVTTEGDYNFVVGEGDSEVLSLKKADLVLRAGAQEGDPRVQPVGFACLALGFVGLIASRKRKDREPATVAPTPKEPEKPKWGRDASGD